MTIYNSFNASVLAWSDHARSPPVVVELRRQAPEGTTLMTMHGLKNKHVVVWSRSNHFILPTNIDVLGGRGNHGRTHAGNVYFTDVVSQVAQEYARTATATRKRSLLREIWTHMHQSNRRFLKLELFDGHHRIYRWIVDPRPLAKIGNKMRDTIDATRVLPALPVAAPFAAPLPINHHPLLIANGNPQDDVTAPPANPLVDNHPLMPNNSNPQDPTEAPRVAAPPVACLFAAPPVYDYLDNVNPVNAASHYQSMGLVSASVENNSMHGLNNPHRLVAGTFDDDDDGFVEHLALLRDMVLDEDV